MRKLYLLTKDRDDTEGVEIIAAFENNNDPCDYIKNQASQLTEDSVKRGSSYTYTVENVYSIAFDMICRCHGKKFWTWRYNIEEIDFYPTSNS